MGGKYDPDAPPPEARPSLEERQNSGFRSSSPPLPAVQRAMAARAKGDHLTWGSKVSAYDLSTGIYKDVPDLKFKYTKLNDSCVAGNYLCVHAAGTLQILDLRELEAYWLNSDKQCRWTVYKMYEPSIGRSRLLFFPSSERELLTVNILREDRSFALEV